MVFESGNKQIWINYIVLFYICSCFISHIMTKKIECDWIIWKKKSKVKLYLENPRDSLVCHCSLWSNSTIRFLIKIIIGLSDRDCYQQNKQWHCHWQIVYSDWCYLACEDLSSQRTVSTHNRNAIATLLWGTGHLGILGYYQPMSLVAFPPFSVRQTNPEVTLPRWVIYLFLDGCLYRQSL